MPELECSRWVKAYRQISKYQKLSGWLTVELQSSAKILKIKKINRLFILVARMPKTCRVYLLEWGNS